MIDVREIRHFHLFGAIGGGADEVMLGILSKLMGIAKRPVH